jgi:hypothetical protein
MEPDIQGKKQDPENSKTAQTALPPYRRCSIPAGLQTCCDIVYITRDREGKKRNRAGTYKMNERKERNQSIKTVA